MLANIRASLKIFMDLLICSFVAVHLCGSSVQVSAFFGLSGFDSMSDRLVHVSGHYHPINQSNLLKGRRRRICRKTKGVSESLADALRYSVSECRRLFQYERWNCSLDSTRNYLLQGSFKETSFLYAISSASLVHSFARACSTGRLDQCTCDVSFNAVENRKAWTWGGCGDNFEYGVRFTRKCILEMKAYDVMSLIHRHNSEVGIKTVKEGVTKVCKCHGVSGSCTSKTCWKQLAPFSYSSLRLKQKYDGAVKAKAGNLGQTGNGSSRKRRKGRRGRRRRNRKNRRKENNRIPMGKGSPPRKGHSRRSRAILQYHSSKSLIYLTESPDFCNHGNFSHGTSGRQCVRGENCRSMCCGRGHNVQLKTVRSSCKCHVVWCCYVKCKVCVSQEEIYTCK